MMPPRDGKTRSSTNPSFNVAILFALALLLTSCLARVLPDPPNISVDGVSWEEDGRLWISPNARYRQPIPDPNQEPIRMHDGTGPNSHVPARNDWAWSPQYWSSDYIVSIRVIVQSSNPSLRITSFVFLVACMPCIINIEHDSPFIRALGPKVSSYLLTKNDPEIIVPFIVKQRLRLGMFL